MDPSSGLGVVAACYTRAYFPLIVSLQFGFQSHHSSTVYVIQSHHVTLQFGVQSHFSSFDVQSHHRFSVSAFKAIVSFSFGVQSRSSPSLGIQSHLSSFGVQSHYPFPAWRSKPPCLLVYDVQSRLSQHDIPSYQFSWAFRATIPSQLGIQSH